MPLDAEPLSPAEKLKALRQIESALGRSKHPMLRACGLTEEVAAKAANEGLVLVFEAGEDDAKSLLDKYAISKISESGLGILAAGDVAEPSPLPVALHPRQEATRSKLIRLTGSGLWEIVKLALAAFFGGVVSWYLTKHLK